MTAPQEPPVKPEVSPPEDPPDDAYRLQGQPRAAAFAERRIAIYWGITTIAALTLVGVYLAGGQNQLEGICLMVALGSLGLGFVVFARDLLPGSEQTAPRHEFVSTPEAQAAVDHAFERGEEPFVRRSFLLKMLTLAGSALGLSFLFPLNSLGPSPGDTLAHTSWKPGSRVVTADNVAVKLGDLEVNGILTVFPEGATTDATSQTILINVGDAPQKVAKGREGWSVDGYVAYSKVCTHAGCPVGLYRSTSHQLLCPCHQSTFDVLDGCRPVFGPACTSLPQLALQLGDDNVLEAQHDYTVPVGPGYWNRS